MAKYKVGDRVKVRSDLKVGLSVPCGVVPAMEKFAGRTVTIFYADSTHYHLEEDTGLWNWSDEMFTGHATGASIPKLKTGMILELQDGHLMMVFRATPKVGPEGCCSHAVGPDDWWALDEFDANGVYGGRTIMKIYVPATRSDFGLPLDKADKTLIWEREAGPKKMTVAEVQAALGYKVEIVGG